jgi:hypothetical protein
MDGPPDAVWRLGDALKSHGGLFQRRLTTHYRRAREKVSEVKREIGAEGRMGLYGITASHGLRFIENSYQSKS